MNKGQSIGKKLLNIRVVDKKSKKSKKSKKDDVMDADYEEK